VRYCLLDKDERRQFAEYQAMSLSDAEPVRSFVNKPAFGLSGLDLSEAGSFVNSSIVTDKQRLPWKGIQG